MQWCPTKPLPSYNWCTQKSDRKPPLLKGKQSEPCKETPSLSSIGREVSSLHIPSWCTQKSNRKPPLLRGFKTSPVFKATSSLLSEVKEVSLFAYPLILVHPKVQQKTTTFERRAKQALQRDSLSAYP